MQRKHIIAYPAITLLALGVGGAATAGEADTPTGTASRVVTAEPEVRTVTKTETRRVKVTPASCLTALDASEGIGAQVVKTMNVAMTYPPLIVKGIKAGATMDTAAIDEITASLNEGTAKIKAINADLTPLVDRFNAAKADCRSH